MQTRHGQLANLALKISDLLLMMAALSFAIVINFAGEEPIPVQQYAFEFLSTRIKVVNALLFAFMLIAWYVIFNLQGVYRSHRLSTFIEELREIGGAVLLATVTLLMVAHIGNWRTINLWTSICVGVFALTSIAVMRALLRLNLGRLRSRGKNLRTLLIIGGGTRAQWLASQIRKRTDLGYRIVGYLDSGRRFGAGRRIGRSLAVVTLAAEHPLGRCLTELQRVAAEHAGQGHLTPTPFGELGHDIARVEQEADRRVDEHVERRLDDLGGFGRRRRSVHCRLTRNLGRGCPRHVG